MKQFVFIFFSYLGFCFPAMANDHDASKLTPDERLKLADRYYAESLFYSAAENYQAYLDKNPDDRYANYWYAMALYESRDYERAAKQFKVFYNLSPAHMSQKAWDAQERDFFKLGNLYYGMTLHRLGEYELAKKRLNLFRSNFQTNDEKEFTTLITLAKKIMNACDSVSKIPKSKIKIKVASSLNSAYNEASPFMLNEDILYYTSLQENSLKTFEGYKNNYKTSIYQATKNKDDQWQKSGKVVSVDINDPKYWVGNGTFNETRTRFYFTKCLERDDDRSLCNLFVSDFKKGKLSEPMQLPLNINYENKFTTTQPAVETGQDSSEIIYFSSDRPGGKGGLDLWYTLRNKRGQFEEPKLVEGGVNTVGDEVTPYFDDSTKTLYFSSDGHIGFGGLDVFKVAKKSDGKNSWGTVKNMGSPLNSGADELYFSRDHSQQHGFFTSNRKGSKPLQGISTASDDIFAWENFKYAVQGDVRKGNANKTIATTDNTILQPENPVTSDSTLSKDSIIEEENSKVIVSKPVDEAVEMTGTRFNLYGKTEDGQRLLLAVDSVSKGGNYFFKLDPDMDYEVEVIKPGYNPVIEQLTTKGLDDEDTLERKFKVDKDGYVIFGEIMEHAKPQNKITGANLVIYEIVNGQQRLIREVKVPENESMYYVILPPQKDYKIMARKDGYFAGTNKFTTKDLGNNTDSVRADIYMKKMQLNVEYRLNNILYEFAKATLTDPSKLVLDTLYNIMTENPSIVIELSSHTDSVGSDAANMKLSQARAKSCVDYLISKGIESKRMIPMGYGERKPIAPNSNSDGTDNPEGRALNRRTEFKVLKT